LNRFRHDLIIPEHRRKFLSDPEKTFEEAGLTEQARAMVRNREWCEMIHYGVIFFMLEKLGAVVGTSVAGRDQGKTDWDKKNRN
jgi:gallate dioxygenase